MCRRKNIRLNVQRPHDAKSRIIFRRSREDAGNLRRSAFYSSFTRQHRLPRKSTRPDSPAAHVPAPGKLSSSRSSVLAQNCSPRVQVLFPEALPRGPPTILFSPKDRPELCWRRHPGRRHIRGLASPKQFETSKERKVVVVVFRVVD